MIKVKNLKMVVALILLIVTGMLLPVVSLFAADIRVIYENNFEADTGAVDIGGNKALAYDVAGDPASSWVTVFQQDLYYEYAEPLYAGALLSFDLYLPANARYTGLLKAQAVTKMGSSWAWTQSNTIQDLGSDAFADQGNGYKKVTVAIGFDTEIETVQGLKAIVPCLAASNCDYKGKIYLDNVKLESAVSGGTELPPVDPVVFDFSDAASVSSWSDGGSWDYSGGLALGYDDNLQAIKLDVDYTANSTSSWSEAKARCLLSRALPLKGYNRFSCDFIYDPAHKTKGSFKLKLFAGLIDVSTDVRNETDFGYGLKKSRVEFSFPGSDNTVYDFTLGVVGIQTDYKGPVYLDNLTFSQANDGFVTAKLVPEAQIPVRANTGSILANGQTQTIPAIVKLADDKASDYTIKLAACLDALGKTDSVLFGHQNDLTHKAGNKALSESDVKDITGSMAAVMGIDTLSLTGNELAEAPWNASLESRVAAVAKVSTEAARQGAVVTLSAHMPNFAIIDQRVKNSLAGTADPQDANSTGFLADGSYNFSGYTPNTLSGDIVKRIMPGQDLNYLFTAYLDMIAAYAKALEAGRTSVLFRPFHENTGSWFWWGRAFCDQEAFKNLYRYTVEYLRDIKNVHNFLYVYGPSSDAETTADYALRYPGDDYVDMVGFDMYHNNPLATDNFIEQFKTELAIVQQFADEHHKLFAVTETGILRSDGEGLKKTGNPRPDWFTEILDAVSATNAAYFLVWANFGENTAFFTPYVVSKTDTVMRGHEMVDNFISYYNDPRSVFAAQMPDASLLAVTVAANTNVSGYIYAPVSGTRVLDEVGLWASVHNLSGNATVKFVARNKSGDIVREIPAGESVNNTYTGTLTAGVLADMGRSSGTMSLVIDGIVYNTINLKYNLPEPVIDPRVVDTFEDYEGDNTILNSSWTPNKATNSAIIPSLSSLCYNGDYSLGFKYTLTGDGGYAGITKNMNKADWSAQNALQLWTIPDGRKQKVVIQVTSGANVFEVYLNEYGLYNDTKYPLLVTIPFSSFKGRDDKTAVFDPANIQSFGLWCNTIVPADQDPATYTVDSILYYDDIKAVSSNVNSVSFTELIPNRSPVLSAIGNKILDEGTTIAFKVSAMDPDGDALILTVSNLPAGATFDKAGGSFFWIPDYDQSGTYKLVFAVSDGKATASEEVMITVKNVSARQFAQKLIATVNAMNMSKTTKQFLVKDLETVQLFLACNKKLLALSTLKLFMLYVKIPVCGKISSADASLLFADASRLYNIIVSE